MIVRQIWPSRPTFDGSLRGYEQLRRDMLHMLDAFAGERDSSTTSGVFPPINITQDSDHFYLRAEIPGIAANELSISALRNQVSISGKRELRKEHDRASYHRRERAEGTFNRTVALPTVVDAEQIEARYTDGILTLVLPKAAEAKPRQIAVKT
jgi:HSP20 family protein